MYLKRRGIYALLIVLALIRENTVDCAVPWFDAIFTEKLEVLNNCRIKYDQMTPGTFLLSGPSQVLLKKITCDKKLFSVITNLTFFAM